VEERATYGLRRLNFDKAVGRVKIVLAAFVDYADVTLRLRVCVS